jgi:hypothetical protein
MESATPSIGQQFRMANELLLSVARREFGSRNCVHLRVPATRLLRRRPADPRRIRGAPDGRPRRGLTQSDEPFRSGFWTRPSDSNQGRQVL